MDRRPTRPLARTLLLARPRPEFVRVGKLEKNASFSCHARLLFASKGGARRKLRSIHQARTLRDLSLRPGNRIEALKHDRIGQHSVRINEQYRVCFVWDKDHASDVEIVDYH
ncbi:MAG TPA: type II toxin-antitoxin system RelE/ParE family toxin [Candidatus Binataceae bacterium]|nr:type II toxin-antitoxin system RelE/ParE family toxin [Candidatus Binataceae bacterium]